RPCASSSNACPRRSSSPRPRCSSPRSSAWRSASSPLSGRGTRYDYAGIVVAVLGQSLPNFWLGIMLILLFGVALRWLPTSGFEGWRHLVLPGITLAAFPTALVARLTRSSMLEILNRDFIRTGRAKGLAERAVILRHALRNAAIPVLTVLGLQIGT